MGQAAAYLYLAIALVSLGVGGAAGAVWHRTVVHAPRYRDPQLHEGIWHRASDARSGVVWHRFGVPWHQADVPPLRHVCQAQTCTLARGLAHEDRCACGAVRYGIYGAWRDVNVRWTQQATF